MLYYVFLCNGSEVFAALPKRVSRRTALDIIHAMNSLSEEYRESHYGVSFQYAILSDPV